MNANVDVRHNSVASKVSARIITNHGDNLTLWEMFDFTWSGIAGVIMALNSHDVVNTISRPRSHSMGCNAPVTPLMSIKIVVRGTRGTNASRIPSKR